MVRGQQPRPFVTSARAKVPPSAQRSRRSHMALSQGNHAVRHLGSRNNASFLFFVLLGSELSSLPPVFFSGRTS